MKYTEFELVDFANYVLNNRLMSSQNGGVGHNEFMGWLEARKPQEFIRRVREYKLDFLMDNPDKNGGFSHLSDEEIKDIDEKLEKRFNENKQRTYHNPNKSSR